MRGKEQEGNNERETMRGYNEGEIMKEINKRKQ